MSLVNDMLRDLDNRRKETGGTSAAVRLTPAPEIAPDLAKRPIMLYLVVALIIAAGAIAWFWIQGNDGNSTRQLNIVPQVVSEPVTETLVEEEQMDEFNTQSSVSQPEGQVELATDITVDDESEQMPIAFATVAEITDTESTLSTRSEYDSDSGQLTNPADTPQVPAEVIAQNNLPEEDDSSVALSSSTSTSLQSLEQVPLSTTQTIKNSAELTPEEKDLIAVQDALRLIANNEKAEAYSLLEQQIITNRYAHQSRETYAKLLIQERNLLGAYELNEAGLALSPNHSGFKKIKARVLIADGQIDAAVDLLLSRAPAVDVDLEYHDILATAQLATRDYEGALISYTGLVQQDQNQGKWWYGFAASQDSLGNEIAAIQGYSQAVRLPNLSANLRRRSQERLAILSQ